VITTAHQQLTKTKRTPGNTPLSVVIMISIDVRRTTYCYYSFITTALSFHNIVRCTLPPSNKISSRCQPVASICFEIWGLTFPFPFLSLAKTLSLTIAHFKIWGSRPPPNPPGLTPLLSASDVDNFRTCDDASETSQHEAPLNRANVIENHEKIGDVI
jgi:hypothetical protein